MVFSPANSAKTSGQREGEVFPKCLDTFNCFIYNVWEQQINLRTVELRKFNSCSLQCWSFCWPVSPLGSCSHRAAGTEEGGASASAHSDIWCVGHHQNTWEASEISSTCLLLCVRVISVMVFLSMVIFFFFKYSCLFNLTVIYERKLRKNPPANQQQILLLAIIINMILFIFVQVDYRKVWNKGLSLALSTALSWWS